MGIKRLIFVVSISILLYEQINAQIEINQISNNNERSELKFREHLSVDSPGNWRHKNVAASADYLGTAFPYNDDYIKANSAQDNIMRDNNSDNELVFPLIFGKNKITPESASTAHKATTDSEFRYKRKENLPIEIISSIYADLNKDIQSSMDDKIIEDRDPITGKIDKLLQHPISDTDYSIGKISKNSSNSAVSIQGNDKYNLKYDVRSNRKPTGDIDESSGKEVEISNKLMTFDDTLFQLMETARSTTYSYVLGLNINTIVMTLGTILLTLSFLGVPPFLVVATLGDFIFG